MRNTGARRSFRARCLKRIVPTLVTLSVSSYADICISIQFCAYLDLCIFRPMKKLIWMGGSLDDLMTFPREARREMGYQLEHVQDGVDSDDWKPMSTVGSGVREIRIREQSGAFRCIYMATRPEGVYALHCFQKKTRKTSQLELDLAEKRFKAIRMKS